MSETDAFDLADFLPHLMNQAADALSLEFQKIYRGRYGMLRTEWRVLFHVGHYGPLTAKEICDRARLHKTKVSRAVAALEDKRFVLRQVREADRRQAELRLTALGGRVFNDLSAEAQRYDAAVRARLSAAEAEVLHSCLRRLAEMPEPRSKKDADLP